MRKATTYRAARRNMYRENWWLGWEGIQPGRYPRKPPNAAKLKAPKPTLPGIIPPILVMMVARGLAAGTLQAFANKRKVIPA